jgi:hypothetical protein
VGGNECNLKVTVSLAVMGLSLPVRHHDSWLHLLHLFDGTIFKNNFSFVWLAIDISLVLH